MLRCCFCGKEIVGFGNNPYPLVEDSEVRCCDECNTKVVIPARLAVSASAKEMRDIFDYLIASVTPKKDGEHDEDND